ncbi:MAG: class I SAM-dependent methyltransferase [Planctomycetota bacterium]
MHLSPSPLARSPRPDLRFPPLERLDRTCAGCERAGLEVFYRLPEVPTNSCILLDDEAGARGYPRAALELAACPACGLVQNPRFEQGRVEYSARYEETQAFSGTFNGFARDLAGRLVANHGLRGKHLLEVGCGKGEFLALLCELGENRGLGVDPGFRPERLESAAGARMRFVRDYYRAGLSDEPFDFVACRHTLEHVPDPLAFLREIRRDMDQNPAARLFVEVPDLLRVLETGAFWDVYYEHCVYFSAGTLARVLRLAGFEVEALELDYGDQYLLAVARPATGAPSSAPLALEDDLERVRHGVRRFQRVCQAQLEAWGDRLRDGARRGEHTALWGSGSKAVSFLTTLGRAADGVDAIVDINPHKHGKFLPMAARRIAAPEALRAAPPQRVVAMNPVYRGEIAADLARLGVRAQLVSV